ncbi:MAG: MFS transporter [Candidatus Saccharibacteria bacterium]
MMQNFIYRVLERRHFWRYASFSEVAELYTARTLRVIAIYMAAGFASVYLYQQGYSLAFIMMAWALYYSLKIPLSFFSAFFAAKFGPKHGILASNIFYIPAMIALGFVPEIGFFGVVIWGVFMAISASLYQICFSIDFSKVKNLEHAGKEIGFMNILEKIAVGISPIFGGLIALWFGAPVVMWVAAVFCVFAAVPLLRTAEQTHTHQKIKFRGFPWRMAIRSLVSEIGIGFDVVATATVWGLFLAVNIFPGAGNDLYVKLGALSSVMILAAIATSYTYGKIIDRKQGGTLLKVSVVMNALVHISRSFVTTPAAVVGTNVTNEVATTGITMAYTRGLFDTADLSGHRIVYLSVIDVFANLGAILACAVALICITLFGDGEGMRVFYLLTGGFVLLSGTAKFPLYRK